ncbi:MAG: hypothetical protein IPO60_09165 [Flavobacteriales bacterium]|jgi:uncharacterized membrane protein|nr:hypothetical protein [Flavobacteriales bacterium]MBK6894177.1 hypothetical protein [Flavobacteriales bacterium]MBK7248113.1 hypothetical protein [Flavobacteriales bacterium]MBK7288474.1 hypothetical protein [Flavobacteriales bacterium]MBK9059704.1 hypothetical protein [Flavobacteriales bacterium]
MTDQRILPLSLVTLVFGVLSIPLAFARQLCAPALIMGVLAIAFYLVGRSKQRKMEYSPGSIKRSSLGFKLALVGSACALAMWVLWATGALP